MTRNFLLILILTLVIAQYTQAQDEKQVKFVIHTEYGDMTGVLYNETPQHKANFIKLVNDGWYENSPFHRIIKDFMIQGGQNADGRMDPGYKVPAEFVYGKFHKKGALAAARQSDQVNPEKASSGSQFYIVQGKPLSEQQLAMFSQRTGVAYTDEQIKAYTTIGGTPHLDGGYTVFGEITEGLNVIDKIASVNTGKMDKPVQDLTMTIEIIK